MSLVVSQLLEKGIDGSQLPELGAVLRLRLEEDGEDFRRVQLIAVERYFHLQLLDEPRQKSSLSCFFTDIRLELDKVFKYSQDGVDSVTLLANLVIQLVQTLNQKRRNLVRHESVNESERERRFG